jgi:hypothetical protein
VATILTAGTTSSKGLTWTRQTRAIFDVDETPVLVESQWGGTRMGPQVAPPVARQMSSESNWHVGLKFWASGCYTLLPLQTDLSRVQEKPLPASALFMPASVSGTAAALKIDTDSRVTTKPLYKRPSGTGLGTGSAGLNPDGSDLLYGRDIPAGGSWTSDLTVADSYVDELTTLLNTFTALSEPLDTILSSQTAQPADQGFALRFFVPGFGAGQHPDYIGIFYFGGYALILRGNGNANLYERAKHGDTRAWEVRETFRWSKPSSVCGFLHALVIWPHIGPQGQRYIAFWSNSLEGGTHADTGSGGVGSTATRAGSLSSSEYLYRWDAQRTASDPIYTSGTVTESAKIYLKERRDIRIRWQVSRIAWETAGTLLDMPWQADAAFTSRAVTLATTKREVSGHTITSSIADGYTGATGSSIASPTVTYAFVGDGTNTPILWGYSISRAPVRTTNGTGIQFSVPVTAVQVGLGESDPRAETAAVTVQDPSDSYQRLRNRGELPFRLQTKFTPVGGSETTVVLFRGYALRPQRTRIGSDGSGKEGRGTTADGRTGVGATKVFPSPEWSRYEVQAAGMWRQLTQTTTRTALSWQVFAHDTAAGTDADGNVKPWKVTDAIKSLLKAAGVPDAGMNIPDLSIRLNPGAGTETSDLILEPSTNIASQVQRLCRAYLNRVLAFDANAGSAGADGVPLGQWILIAPPADGTVTPITAFTTAPQAVGKMFTLNAYATGTVPVISAGSEGRPEEYIEPPEHNHVWGLCLAGMGGSSAIRIDNHIYNYQSYAVPGSTVTLDPDSPHYIGTERLLVVGDPTLWGGSGSSAKTQHLVDYLLLRLFVATCLPRRVLTFTAPLHFVVDADSGNYRPLRYYDPVTYNGDPYYVRSVQIDYTADTHQLAHYTLETVVPYATP